jgi:hypothetical protein
VRIFCAVLLLSLSTGCAHRLSFPPAHDDFIGFEDSRQSFVVTAEPYLSPSLNQTVFGSDLTNEGILPIQLSITNLGASTLAPSGLPQLRETDGAVWTDVPARDIARQIRRPAIMNGLMARAPFLGLLAAPFGLILAPIIGGTAEMLASHQTNEANHDMTHDVVELAFRPVTIAPGDTHRVFLYFRMPAPNQAITEIKPMVLTLSIEDTTTRRTFQSAITIQSPAYYTRATAWDRPAAGSAGFAKLSSPAPVEPVRDKRRAQPAQLKADIQYKRALAEARNGQWDAALEALSHAVKADGSHGEAFFGRGVLRARKGQFSEATADLTRAIDLGLSLTDIHNHRGLIHARVGKDHLAIHDWTMAASLSPNFPLPFYNRGMLFWAQGQSEQAKSDLGSACNLGFERACHSLSDLEARWPCCPPGLSQPPMRKQDFAPLPDRIPPSVPAISTFR